jgi:hypothetical protein
MGRSPNRFIQGPNEEILELRSASFVAGRGANGESAMAKAGILWLLGVPAVVIVLLALFTNII